VSAGRRLRSVATRLMGLTIPTLLPPEWRSSSLGSRDRPGPSQRTVTTKSPVECQPGQRGVSRRLAAADIDEYGRGKNAMVQQILAAAGLTAAERASIDANQVPSHDEVPR
jgi:hypothetical protein